MSSPERSLFRDAIAAVLLFVLLLEWLRPLLEMSEWSGIYQLRPFMTAFGLFVLVDWLRLSPWVGWPIKLLVCFSLVAYLFDSAFVLDGDWIMSYAGLTVKDWMAAVDGAFGAISPENRTVLFLFGWSMMIAVIYDSVVERKQPLWFVAITLVYLVGLQLWPGLNTSKAIIRTVWFGFLLIGLVQLSRVEGRFSLSKRLAGWPIGWVAAVALVLVVAVSAGLWLPRNGDSGMMKPLDVTRLAGWDGPWSTRATADGERGGFGAAGAGRTGYGSDDALLGGPLTVDDSIAFTATTEQLTYWRGEAKTVYTGKGWESGGSTRQDGATETDKTAPTIKQEVTIVDPALTDRLFAGGPIERVERMISRSGNDVPVEDAVMNVYGSYLLTEPNARDPLQYYRLAVAMPQSSEQTATSLDQEPAQSVESGEAATANSNEPGAAGSPASDERRAFSAELQLPPSLPDRVKLLAETIAPPAQSAAARAQAIETYLKTNYTYRLDVPAPAHDAVDFADTFLFEDKSGYCDYFSTAMVVLLRSSGIPARWVKGFAPGEQLSADGGVIRVTVRNSDAHSWVEAYIDGRGWVAFDPTPGNVPLAGAAAPAAARAAMAAQPATGGAQPLEERLAEAVGALRLVARERLDAVAAAANRRLAETGALWLLPAAALALAAALLPRLGRHMRLRRMYASPDAPAYAGAGVRGARGAGAALRAWNKLWAALFRRLGGKQPTLTVREYVETIAVADESKREALRDAVKQYEAVRYGGAKPPRSAGRQLKELWRRIR